MDNQRQFEAGPEHLASDFLAAFRARGAYKRDNITRLTDLATSEDERVAEQATRTFFTSLVEKLADSFDPAAVTVYNQAVAQLIQVCRHTKRGRALDERLGEFGLVTEDDLLIRAESLRRATPLIDRRSRASDVRRVIVLSRVTLGADVAITSVILERLKQVLPQAAITLVGGRKASDLFGGDPRLAFKEINYPKAATAADRLLAWLPLLECVRELAGDAEDCLIVDPDSRLTQLGLLPLTGEAGNSRSHGTSNPRYLFFPSREYRRDSSASLSELTSWWLDEVFGASTRAYPSVALTRADLESARELVKLVKRESHPVITINFGVGENTSKRVGDHFERELVSHLLRDGATIVLDKGAGADEARRAQGIVEFARQASRPPRVIEADDESLPRLLGADRLEGELLVWDGRIGMLAALIRESDLYIGYDSAGQHIAAALGVPCIDVFAGFTSRRMLDRWRPTGKADTRVVVVEQSMSEDEVLAETLRHARLLMKTKP